ncbi:uncharacterized protein BDR25DRAFT_108753 [Lindgomyces ingoldianus]|uniref:Uncharacterized protein n=1 Tax=Lindgomyces ingoldianus TaxID=673940 RepID=A0ACB6QAQ9_9PLEO|nr:uncharacterized protein BDR25DRAFT_108753 [Lindgomyces ingoldianus]KAF2463467.1 hypothetical protein BDR25DRAFT_108753 [Lindgomyces ingoldianus]
MKPSNAHRSSADITDRQTLAEPPSPAPTYCSTFHSEKDYPTTPKQIFNSLNNDSKYHPSPTSTSKFSTFSTKNEKGAFIPCEEPFDTNHPHYAPPSPQLPPRTPSRSQKAKRRLPSLRLLLPWTLALIFFLTTLWYTSILVGVRFLDILHPDSAHDQPINIVINDLNGAPSVVISTEPTFVLTSLARVPTATLKPAASGNEQDPNLGTNTVTSKPVVVVTTASATFVTITKRGT